MISLLSSTSEQTEPRRHRFTREMRLAHRREFDAVFAGRCRKNMGPVAVLAIPAPDDVTHHRLGLSIGRRVGHAVRRHHVKRMIREAFRLDHQDWPGRYDLVVVAYPHGDLPLSDYRRMLCSAVASLHRRMEKQGGAGQESPTH